MHIFSILCAITWALVSANEFIRRVTKSSVKAPWEANPFDYQNIARFGESDTLILTFGNRLHISYDDGEHWQPVSGIEGSEICVSIDRFHQDRASTCEYVPRVTKSFLKTPESHHFKANSFRFDNSDTLICVISGFLRISFNNGGSWHVVDKFKEENVRVGIDLFHKGRAFVKSKGGKVHVTEDEGRSWKELYFPKESDEHIERLEVRTHPTDRTLLLFHVNKGSYVSENGGQSIRRIPPPVRNHGTTPTSEDHWCHFAVSSKESTFANNGIYCIHNARYAEKPSAIEGYTELREGETYLSTLSYTADFGKTTRMFDELNSFSIQDIFTFPCAVIVLATKGRSHEKTKSLWISKGEHFEPVHLPNEVTGLRSVSLLPLSQDLYSGYDQKLLLLNVRTKDGEAYNPLVLDLSTLNFFRYRTSPYDDRQLSLKRGIFYLNENPEWAHYSKFNFARFDGSETSMFLLDGFLYISFNNGESWKAVDRFRGGDAVFVNIDLFHKGRAFVKSKDGKLHVTEDEGKTWKELYFPKESDEHIECLEVRTHPTDRKLLLFHIASSIRSWSRRLNLNVLMKRTITFLSDDYGQSFRHIIAPSVNYEDVPPLYERYDCSFAVSSKESTLEDNGIYCLHYATYAQNLDSKEPEKDAYKSSLFYTSDFGKTTKTFDEFNGLSIGNIFAFPSNVLVLTSEGDEENQKLWIYKGGSFRTLSLPDEVTSLEETYLLHEYDPKQLFLNVRVKDDNDRRMLVLDTSNLNFSLRGPAQCPCNACLTQVGNLKGTFSAGYVGNGELSFDAGRSWTKNLRVVDPSEKHKDIFEGGTEDMKNRFFDGALWFSPDEPTAGILMNIATVAINKESKNEDDMTFISRDGGDSWEVGFEFPVRPAFLDYGNIIVAIPTEKRNLYTRCLFSLDQGRTWDEYRFEEPISGGTFQIHSLGLKALIEIRKEKSNSVECLFYLLDFSNIFGGTSCTEDDLERWYLYDGKCIDGVRYSFDRRKADAKCLVRKTFRDLELHEERCVS